jgi:hypothetical protein
MVKRRGTATPLLEAGHLSGFSNSGEPAGSILSNPRRRTRRGLRPYGSPNARVIRDHAEPRHIIQSQRVTFPRNYRELGFLKFQLLSIGRCRLFRIAGAWNIGREPYRLETIGLPDLDSRLGNPHSRSLVQSQLAEHRHLQQHQGASDQLGQRQPVEKSQVSGAQEIHFAVSLLSIS